MTDARTPRRYRPADLSHAERAIMSAKIEVEAAGAHQTLNRARILLQQAQAEVADYIDYHQPA